MLKMFPDQRFCPSPHAKRSSGAFTFKFQMTDSLADSDQKTLKVGIHSFPA